MSILWPMVGPEMPKKLSLDFSFLSILPKKAAKIGYLEKKLVLINKLDQTFDFSTGAFGFALPLTIRIITIFLGIKLVEKGKFIYFC